ncbi:Glutamate--cysteine ligase [Forsythia ovata]|uniref:Glutamate--cysteine ligase n=1 Tax=Forsythia ovata TaxID=205694 RepID=A0ABD1W3H9_9LAMI
MALMSQAGSSHCIHSEMILCKVRYNGVRSIANNMAESKMKEFFGLGQSSWNSLKVIRNLNLDGVDKGERRGHQLIVSASPPTEDAVIAAEPLTKEDLVGYLASGCKPKEKWRIGTEHEKFGFEFGTLRPMKYEQIAELLNGISERFDWDKIMEGD